MEHQSLVRRVARTHTCGSNNEASATYLQNVIWCHRHQPTKKIYTYIPIKNCLPLLVWWLNTKFSPEIGKWQKIRLTMRIHLYVGNFPGVVPVVHIYFLTFSCLVFVYLTTWKYCNILSALHLSNLWALSSKTLYEKELKSWQRFQSSRVQFKTWPCPSAFAILCFYWDIISTKYLWDRLGHNLLFIFLHKHKSFKSLTVYFTISA